MSAISERRERERAHRYQLVITGKDAIVSPVAIDGFSELAAHLRRARLAASEPGQALRAVCRAGTTTAAMSYKDR